MNPPEEPFGQHRLLYRRTAISDEWGVSTEVSLYKGIFKGIYLLEQVSYNKNTNTIIKDVIGLNSEIAADLLPFLEQIACDPVD